MVAVSLPWTLSCCIDVGGVDDVADYRDVDPKIGTLADFDAMSTAFKAAGIKLILDIVPNHSSTDHEWFQQALKAPKGSNARDRSIFRDGYCTARPILSVHSPS